MHLIKDVFWLVLALFVVAKADVMIKSSHSKLFTKDVRTSSPPTLLDTLRQRYFAIEQAFWHGIDNGMEKTNLLQQIHGGHLSFLRDNFSEKSCHFSSFDPEQGALYEAIKKINQSVATTVGNYLHSSRFLFNERESLLISGRNINLTHELDKIFEVTGTKEFYSIIRNKAQLKLCDKNVQTIKSANQLIYEYYHDISAAELKGYALVQLAFMFYTVYNRGNYRSSAQDLRLKYSDRMHQTEHIVKHLLETSKRDIWRCDPNHFSVGTYEEVTNFLTGYVDNEVNLNAQNTCTNTCEDYRVTEHYGCYPGTYCAQKPEGADRDRVVCKGKVVDCQFIGSDLNICSSPQQFIRRYDVLHYDNGNILGRNGSEKYESCHDTSDRVQSWTRWVVRCTNCFCLCDDQQHSERHFSLRDVASDVYNNKVVSGVALRKFQGVFHLMITERELQPYAILNATVPTWHTYNSLDYFNIHDALVREGIDYHTLTWENRAINLDSIELPAGKIVTGIRFRIINGAISLQVRGTDFDFISGKLRNIGSSSWYTAPKKERTEIVVDEPDVPTLTPEKSIPNIQADKFIRFGPTDKFKDLSQSTVPFIDSQLVEPHNPVPLSGVGLYFKSFPGYGGFVAPKILNYNLAPHISGTNELD